MAHRRILVSNDDGYQSEGIQALVEAVSPLGEVWVVAPDREQSASSHSLTIHRPLRVREVRPRWYSVNGTPSDCSYLAVHRFMKDGLPDLLVSGINHGANLAEDVIYSGTVAAAMEGALLGIPAIAFSLVTHDRYEFAEGARFARALVKTALERRWPRMLLNVNIPGKAPLRGYRVTKLGRHSYGGGVLEARDPRGRCYYWIGGNEYQHEDLPGSDCNAVLDDGLISVTPLAFNLFEKEPRTAESPSDPAEEVRSWPIEGFTQS